MPISAGVIGDLQMAAVVALIFVASQGGGSADLNGMHDSQGIAG
jgi:hypothetical protein